MSYPTFTLSRGSTSLELTATNGYTVLPGVEGFDTPPVALSESEPADFDGSVVTNVRYEPREVFIPLLLEGSDSAQIRQRTRELASLLNPQNGMVTLTLTYPKATSGELLSSDAMDGKSTSFESSPSAVTAETTVVRTGSNSFSIGGAVSGPDGAILKAAERPVSNLQAPYRLSAWGRTAQASAREGRIGIQWYDSGGNLLSTTLTAAKPLPVGEWVNFTVEAVGPPGAAKVGAIVQSRSSSYWDDFSITERVTTREIQGYLAQPLSNALDATESENWRRLGITLRCPDPFWLGAEDGAFIPPSWLFYTPAAAPIKILLAGDAVVWPTIKTNYANIRLLASNDSNDVIAGFRVDGPGSDIVTINTDPRNLSVTLPNGDDAWSAISDYGDDPASFFAIPPGESYLWAVDSSFPVQNADISATWRSRWLTAW